MSNQQHETPAGYDWLTAQAAAIERVYFASAPGAVVCSPPKGGKTVDGLYMLPRALATGRAIDLKSGYATVGWIPPDTDANVNTLDDLYKSIEARVKQGKGGLRFVNPQGVPLVGVLADDYSRRALAQKDLLEPRIPKNADGKPNNFWIWNEIGKIHNKIVRLLNEMGQPFYFSCHPKEPSIDEKTKEPIPGHPEVASHAIGMNLSKDLPLVAYAQPDPTRAMLGNRWGWGLHACPLGGKWIAGDRHGIVVDGTPGYPATTPFNTAEVFRYAGYNLPRAYGFDWAEEIVEQGFQYLLTGVPQQVMIKELLVHIRQTHPEAVPLQVTWILRDIVDRHEIRTKSRRADPLKAWGSNF